MAVMRGRQIRKPTSASDKVSGSRRALQYEKSARTALQKGDSRMALRLKKRAAGALKTEVSGRFNEPGRPGIVAGDKPKHRGLPMKNRKGQGSATTTLPKKVVNKRRGPSMRRAPVRKATGRTTEYTRRG